MLAEPIPRRWQHVQAVGAKAERLERRLRVEDIQILAAAGWLHDIGYSPSIKETGFHALDGARWLVSQGLCPRLASLIAHHSCAS
ncbi:HD domain-containing protein [Micromonospora chalcea]